jgi:DNA-binding beta-propeller fold protein YncE
VDKTSLRVLLERALENEPQMGSLAHDSLRAGIKLRRRRRAQGAAGSLAAVAVIAIVVPLAISTPEPITPAPKSGRGPIAYVGGDNGVTPIFTATNTAGKPLSVGRYPGAITITPDGKTAYIASQGTGRITPISTATNKEGKSFKVGLASAMAITPDGKTLYVASLDPYIVTPITLATDKKGKPIPVGVQPRVIVITPDGKTAYVIKVGAEPQAIVIAPDGKSAYVPIYKSGVVIPIATASNRAGTPIKVGKHPYLIAITP